MSKRISITLSDEAFDFLNLVTPCAFSLSTNEKLNTNSKLIEHLIICLKNRDLKEVD